jgi:hypothetical protein
MLITMILDDTEGENVVALWNIYYHLFLDSVSSGILQTQVQKLLAISNSLQEWYQSPYGKVLRFYDQKAFLKVRKTSKSYLTADLNEVAKSSYNARYTEGVERAKQLKKDLHQDHKTLTGVRSAAPATMHAFTDIPDLFDHFWEHGVTAATSKSQPRADLPNPLFLSPHGTLHYGTDPILGFHLVTAYSPLASGSLNLAEMRHSNLHKAVQAARIQFRTWSSALRRIADSRLILRYCCAEALALCHTLQCISKDRTTSTAHWYSAPYSVDPLVLDGDDLQSKRAPPLAFNVIDTSNLVDHIGAVKIMVAASPLLANTASSIIYTESLVKREATASLMMENLLCGDFATMSILFGLRAN